MLLGQVSQQFAVDVIPQQGPGVVHADSHSAVGEKAVTPTGKMKKLCVYPT